MQIKPMTYVPLNWVKLKFESKQFPYCFHTLHNCCATKSQEIPNPTIYTSCVFLYPAPSSPQLSHIVCSLTFAFAQCASIQHYMVLTFFLLLFLRM